jgi:hypothetical protein
MDIRSEFPAFICVARSRGLYTEDCRLSAPDGRDEKSSSVSDRIRSDENIVALKKRGLLKYRREQPIKKPSFQMCEDSFFILRVYFFLWLAQNLDFPDAEFLHAFPSLVFAAHLAFFTAAIFSPPFLDEDFKISIPN